MIPPGETPAPLMTYDIDKLVLVPDDIDLSRSPMAGHLSAKTYILGVFNPGLLRLPNGNLLMMARVAEALETPIFDGQVHAIRWEETSPGTHRFVLDGWPLDQVDTSDPRKFTIRGGQWKVMALTSLSWLLPVELTPDGLSIVAIHYDKAIIPHADFQRYGIEDPRISRVENRWLMTICSVGPERHATCLYSSSTGFDWAFEGMVLDHQNKDMLIFEGLIDGHYWAQTRPMGSLYFAYPPESEWRAGPSINLALSKDALFWKPYEKPSIRARSDTMAMERIGGGTPPILTDEGWLTLWHGVEPRGVVGIYRTYWSILDKDDPSIILRTSSTPLIEANPHLTEPIAHQMYLSDIVFSTGIVDAGGHYIVASGEGDLACRITHIPKTAIHNG